MESHLKLERSSHGFMVNKDCNKVSDCTIFEVEEETGDSPSTVGPLQDMSSLLQQLPNSKRGLSKHYKGKSQSFTSLDKVECLQDLVKPENPYNKRLKGAKSVPFNTNYLRLISKTSDGKYVVAGADAQSAAAVTKPRRTTSTSDFSKHQTPLFA